MRGLIACLGLFAILGCGESQSVLRSKTMSILAVEADRWEGTPEFFVDATDAYDHPITSRVEKTTLNYVLELRSSGRDGLPKNDDDIVVRRTKRHGESSVTDQAAKTAERISESAASGVVQGIRKGLRAKTGSDAKNPVPDGSK